MSIAELQRSGDLIAAEFIPLELNILSFMVNRGRRAGTLTVSKDNELVVSRAYESTSIHGLKPLPPESLFRIASITKSFTRVAIEQLIQSGQIKPETKAFPLIGIEKNHFSRITVDHLINHQGGWDRNKAPDPMFYHHAIGLHLGVLNDEDLRSDKVNIDHILEYMKDQPLQFEPGTVSAYSNFGYCVLGRVIEAISGQTYSQYLQENVLNLLDLKSTIFGCTRWDLTDPREVTYLMDEEELDPYRHISLEILESAGGLVSSGLDLCKFFDHFWVDGKTRNGEVRRGMVAGSLPGTSAMAMQEKDLTMVALFNSRDDWIPRWQPHLQSILEKASS